LVATLLLSLSLTIGSDGDASAAIENLTHAPPVPGS
jgi:hypothetical protein